jgi:hypothetical protein
MKGVLELIKLSMKTTYTWACAYDVLTNGEALKYFLRKEGPFIILYFTCTLPFPSIMHNTILELDKFGKH